MTRVQYSRNDRNRLSDRDMFLDLLTSEKYISHFYDHAVLESSGDLIRDTFQTLQQTSQSNAQKLYETMQQHGWYNNKTTRVPREYPEFTKKNSRSSSFRKGMAEAVRTEPNINPGFNGTYRGKSGIFKNSPRYIEQYNTPQ